MLSRKNISYYFRYPLMLVMLLWALTLPGQEAEVYRFLINGKIACSNTVPDAKGTPTVKQQAVQVFLDAKTSSYIVVHPQQAINPLLLLIAFAFPASNALHTIATGFSGQALLARSLLITILPNAP